LLSDGISAIFQISKQFKIKCWGDQCVAFHVPTGQTHLLESLAAFIVQQIQKNFPISFDSLSENILNSHQSESYSKALIDTYVRQLQILNIIIQHKTL